MRPFEIAFLTIEALLLVIIMLPWPPSRRWCIYAAIACLVVAALQVSLEGPRWQMAPAYALGAILFVAAWVRSNTAARDTTAKPLWRRIVVALGFAVATVLAITLPAAVPVFQFPELKGPYAIGTLTYHWVDYSRPNMFSADLKERRELMVQVWYPAKVVAGPKFASYWQQGTNFAVVAKLIHLPSFFFDHLKYVKTHAMILAPVAPNAKSFPVILFSTGRFGYRGSSTFEIERLVSQGYIVVGMDHPYTSGDVVFPDGHHASIDLRVARSIADEGMRKDIFMLKVVDNLGYDAVFTLDKLVILNRKDPILSGHLDLSHVGIFGTSLGGFTVAEACRLDQRFRACLILDVNMPPDVVRAGLRQPTMWISRAFENIRQDEGWSPSATRELRTTMRAVFEELPGQGYLVLIQGMYHPDISDLPMIMARPLGRLLEFTGPRDWHETHRIINAYSLAFFDKYLRGKSEYLLDATTSPFSGVDLVTRRQGSADKD